MIRVFIQTLRNRSEWLPTQRTGAAAKEARFRFRYRAPDAGAICFARYDAPIGSVAFAEKLRVEKSVLVVPGEHFGMDEYVRIGFGNPAPVLLEALARIREAFDDVVSRAPG